MLVYALDDFVKYIDTFSKFNKGRTISLAMVILQRVRVPETVSAFNSLPNTAKRKLVGARIYADGDLSLAGQLTQMGIPLEDGTFSYAQSAAHAYAAYANKYVKKEPDIFAVLRQRRGGMEM